MDLHHALVLQQILQERLEADATSGHPELLDLLVEGEFRVSPGQVLAHPALTRHPGSDLFQLETKQRGASWYRSHGGLKALGADPSESLRLAGVLQSDLHHQEACLLLSLHHFQLARLCIVSRDLNIPSEKLPDCCTRLTTESRSSKVAEVLLQQPEADDIVCINLYASAEMVEGRCHVATPVCPRACELPRCASFGQMLHDDERIHLPKGFKAPDQLSPKYPELESPLA
mmetsp:Transcript_53466/g.125438  ORF Transcript_53466/g.125438 Transcript_53466/m.125438 type:complete len:230 (-) Transcript_53466:169-858(-)